MHDIEAADKADQLWLAKRQKRLRAVLAVGRGVQIALTVLVAVLFIVRYAYTHDVECARPLPEWLLVWGVAMLLLIPLGWVVEADRQQTRPPGMGMAVLSCVSYWGWALLFVWFIVGNVWVFSTHPNPARPGYCNRLVWMWCLYWLMICYLIIVIPCGCMCVAVYNGCFHCAPVLRVCARAVAVCVNCLRQPPPESQPASLASACPQADPQDTRLCHLRIARTPTDTPINQD